MEAVLFSTLENFVPSTWSSLFASTFDCSLCSLSKMCMSNPCPSLGLETYLNLQGELIPITLNAIFLHSDSCSSRLWKGLYRLGLGKTLLASTGSLFFPFSVTDMLLYRMGTPNIPPKSHLSGLVGLYGLWGGTVSCSRCTTFIIMSLFSAGTVMWE